MKWKIKSPEHQAPGPHGRFDFQWAGSEPTSDVCERALSHMLSHIARQIQSKHKGRQILPARYKLVCDYWRRGPRTKTNSRKRQNLTQSQILPDGHEFDSISVHKPIHAT